MTGLIKNQQIRIKRDKSIQKDEKEMWIKKIDENWSSWLCDIFTILCGSSLLQFYNFTKIGHYVQLASAFIYSFIRLFIHFGFLHLWTRLTARNFVPFTNYIKIVIYIDFTIKKLHEKYYSPFLFLFSKFNFHSFIKIS